jgi:phosphohistidine phosphatase SixA
VRLLGVELGRAGWRPDRAFSSPYARARDTAALVLGTAGVPFAAGILSELEPETEPDHASRALAALLDGARHLLVVGHQPLLGRLTGYWTGALATLEPGELVHLEFDSLPGPGAGRLVDRIAPRRSV